MQRDRRKRLDREIEKELDLDSAGMDRENEWRWSRTLWKGKDRRERYRKESNIGLLGWG